MERSLVKEMPRKEQIKGFASTVLTRREVLIGTGAVAASLGAAVALSDSLAQGPDKEPQTGTGPATPNPLSGTPVPVEVTTYANDWPVAQGDLQSTRAAKNSPIDSSNVGSLEVAWQVPIDVGITATPVIMDGIVYYQDMMSNVFAMDLATGKEIWRKDYNVSSNGPNGVAIGYGMVFAATGDNAIAFALDVSTGDELWSAHLTNNNYECIDMAPGLYDNTVFISTNPNDTEYGNYRGGARGILYALDAKTGGTLWSFDTAADNLWEAPRLNSGAGLWYPPSFDEQGNMYIGTGNAGPYPGNDEYPNGSSRPGPNDYAASMVSIDLQTGGPNWTLNANPHDIQDHDFQNSPVLATVKLNETDTLIAVGSGKTGTVIAASAETGAMLWRTAVGKHQDDLMQELPPGTTEIYPGTLGGVLTPLAFSDGRIFATYIDLPAYLAPTGAGERPEDRVAPTGGVCALDATNGDILWDNKIPSFVLTGATVANDVVFVSGFEGVLRAYNVESGEEIWNIELPAGTNAPLAIAGDTIVLAAAAGISVAPTNGTPAPEREPKPNIVALKLPS
jgi:outer membrane protein assembly factor BamB